VKGLIGAATKPRRSREDFLFESKPAGAKVDQVLLKSMEITIREESLAGHLLHLQHQEQKCD